MKLKTFFLFLSYFSVSLLQGQSLAITQARMSSGDSKKDIICAGMSTDGELTVLDDNGQIFLYDGIEYKSWSDSALSNPSFYLSVFVEDSVAFLLTTDALLMLDQSSKKPRVLNRSEDHYLFLSSEFQLIYFSNSSYYNIEKSALSSIEEDDFLLSHPQHVRDQFGENYDIYKGSLKWTDNQGHHIFDLQDISAQQLIVDPWNEKWLVANEKLHLLTADRFHEQSSQFLYENMSPRIVRNTTTKLLMLYQDNQLVEWKLGQAQKISCPIQNRIANVWLDNYNHIWCLDDRESLHFYSGQDWFEWSDQLDGFLDEIVGFMWNEDIVSLVTKNSGILQSRKEEDQNDWIWIPHRLNRELDNLDILEIAARDKLYLFTTNFGIFTVDQKKIGTIKKGFPNYGIQKVKVQDDKAILLDKAKHWLQFNFGRKSLKKLDPDIKLPKITSSDFAIAEDKIAFLSGKELVIYLTEIDRFAKIPSPCSLEKCFLLNNSIVDFSQGQGCSTVLPGDFPEVKTPKLASIILKNAHGNSFELYPERQDFPNLKQEDFPLSIEAHTSLPSNPRAIEYAWLSQSLKLKQDFQFNNNLKISSAVAGPLDLQLTLKLGEFQSEYLLTKLHIAEEIVQKDRTWAIYLSAILSILLLSFIVYFRLRSRRQKRKILQLEIEKRALELEQNALQLQMNPHFIFNALNGVKGMIATGEDKKARQYLTKISSWMRSMLNDSRTDRVTISKELQNLQSYIQIEQELQGHKWDFQFVIDDEIDQTEYIAPMMIQPFIENAIIHAFSGLERQGELILRMNQKGRRLLVEIEDNGVGLKSGTAKKHESVALKLIQDRLKLMNQGTALKEFSLINKKDENEISSGVLVKILLPIKD